ncbi:MAG: GntR family transcriptional regulator [Hyphomicrobium sp.]|uniref:GntR family transcriptional regulator n=1 Tax=Hyphomicrobium sp. TaxID=82 RepID=UPI001326C388|nr:GntR family transcriptional regulator [Hyphomicrobium sp.]KAB2937850.1 MAG: GntR family transcriptional regulator [Hyphomicrobium sp.]MBZ0211219.1 GntR family transcriptional regulator [Hyphomicrobium sp.]MCZ7594321.1 GntR family transcriptional regulator [Hyphomicrobium sp.]
MADTLAFERQPLYQQVSNLLMERIAAGVWKPGQLLPSEVDLARELTVSIGTLRKAFDKLESERLLIRRQGRGTFVNDCSSEEMLTLFRSLRDAEGRPLRDDVQPIEQRKGPATALERERLQLSAEDPVLRTRRLRCCAGRPLMYEEARLALSRFPAIDRSRVAGDYRIMALAQRCGMHLARASERVSLAEATGEVGELLGIEPGKALLRLDRVILTMHGEPVEWRIGLCNLKQEFYHADIR